MVGYARYVAMMLWPSDLAVLYPHPTKPHAGGIPLTGWQCAQAALVLVLISVAVVRVRRRYAIVGWLWYLVSMLPVIGFIQIGSHALADRYTYIPSIGLFALACFGSADWAEGLARRWRHALPVAGVLTVAVIAAYGAAARSHVAVWRDSESLYEQALRVNPRNVMMHYNLGNLLRAHGEIDAAMERFRKVTELDRGHFQAHINLCEALATKKRHPEAIESYRFALRIRPKNAIAHNNLGNSLSDIGEHDEAMVHYRAAIAEHTGSPLPHYNLGNLLQKKRRHAEAEMHYREAIAIKPGYASAISNLGNALLSQGKREEAIVQYRRALQIDPDNRVSLSGLKIALEDAPQPQ
jgi:tetratricopeptide (TPR) repeat protein